MVIGLPGVVWLENPADLQPHRMFVLLFPQGFLRAWLGKMLPHIALRPGKFDYTDG